MQQSQIRWMLPFLFAAAMFQPVQAQQVRTVDTQVIQPRDAPVRINTYTATYQMFEDSFSAIAFLKENVALENISQDRVAAVQLQIIYLGAFGEQIDTVSETIISEIKAHASVTETFHSQLPYTVPVYSAIVYPRKVRLEAAGQPDRATIWQADSTDVARQVWHLVERLTLAQEQD